jgi:hypothetical protein
MVRELIHAEDAGGPLSCHGPASRSFIHDWPLGHHGCWREIRAPSAPDICHRRARSARRGRRRATRLLLTHLLLGSAGNDPPGHRGRIGARIRRAESAWSPPWRAGRDGKSFDKARWRRFTCGPGGGRWGHRSRRPGQPRRSRSPWARRRRRAAPVQASSSVFVCRMSLPLTMNTTCSARLVA